MTTTQPHPAIPVHATLPASSAPPAKISSNSHLDPSSYVKGRYQLTIEPNVVVHPRTYLFTELGPVTIRQGSIITEKCVIGRRDKTESSHQKGQPSIAIVSAVTRPLSISEAPENPVDAESETNTAATQPAASISELPEIIIGPNAHLHASVTIQAPSTIGDSAIIEPGVMISPNCSVGAHSKICAGVTLPAGTNVPEWTVVYGMNGQMRRRRQADVAEDARLDAMMRERQGVESLLKMNAGKSLAQAGAGGAPKSKRESMIRG